MEIHARPNPIETIIILGFAFYASALITSAATGTELSAAADLGSAVGTFMGFALAAYVATQWRAQKRHEFEVLELRETLTTLAEVQSVCPSGMLLTQAMLVAIPRPVKGGEPLSESDKSLRDKIPKVLSDLSQVEIQLRRIHNVSKILIPDDRLDYFLEDTVEITKCTIRILDLIQQGTPAHIIDGIVSGWFRQWYEGAPNYREYYDEEIVDVLEKDIPLFRGLARRLEGREEYEPLPFFQRHLFLSAIEESIVIISSRLAKTLKG